MFETRVCIVAAAVWLCIFSMETLGECTMLNSCPGGTEQGRVPNGCPIKRTGDEKETGVSQVCKDM